MRILHVLSGDFMAGSETSTAVLAEEQVHQGHRVYIAAGSFNRPGKAIFHPVPIYRRSPLWRIRNVIKLAGIIRAEKIDLVHAHSRAASWVSHWACRFTGTAHLSTIHGRQHLHLTNRFFNVYGMKCACVCENIREQMLEETRVFQPEQLVVVRNGLRLP